MIGSPRLVAHPNPPESTLKKVAKGVATLFKIGASFVTHAMSLALIFGMGWVISQTFFFQFIAPALKQTFFNAAALWLPPAIAPWAPTILLGGLGAIIGAQVLYAIATGTFGDGPNAKRPWGTMLYVGSAWVLPGLSFAYNCSHGAPVAASLYSATLWGAVIGTALTPVVPILDNPARFWLTVQKTMQWIGETLVPTLQWTWRKANEIGQRHVMPVIGEKISWVKDVFKRLIGENAAPVPAAVPLPPRSYAEAMPDHRPPAPPAPAPEGPAAPIEEPDLLPAPPGLAP